MQLVAMTPSNKHTTPSKQKGFEEFAITAGGRDVSTLEGIFHVAGRFLKVTDADGNDCPDVFADDEDEENED